MRLLAAFAAVVLTSIPAGIGAAPARATGDEVALNGTFTARSDGLWAKTNEIMRYQADVTATWSINSSCTTYQDCTGIVSSDQGWTAPLTYRSQLWRTDYTVVDWHRCPDGSSIPGHQTFTFSASRLDSPDRHDRLTGWTETLGPSGGCGVNRPLNVRMPFTLVRVAR